MRIKVGGVGRRPFLKTIGAGSIAGIAGCSGGGDGDAGSDGDGGTTTAPPETTTGATTTQGSEDPIVIGNASPLSGPFTPWGQLYKQGADFAASELNDDGGVLGREVRVVSQDTEATPGTAATVFRRLVSQEGATSIVGPVNSAVAIRLREVAEELEVPQIPNQGSSAQLLTKDARYTFRLSGPATPWLAAANAGVAEETDVGNYGVIVADYNFGHSYRTAIQRAAEDMSGVTFQVETAPVGAQDFSSVLRRLPTDVDYLDLMGHPVGMFNIIPQARDLGFDPQTISGSYAPSQFFFNTLGEAVTNGITLFPPIDKTSDRYAEVGSRFYEATEAYFDHYTAFGYVAVNLIAEAIESAGDASGTAIRDAISAINYDSMLSYPQVSYNEWGELEETRVIAQSFTLETPPYFPDGQFSFEKVYESEVYGPVDPTNWD